MATQPTPRPCLVDVHPNSPVDVFSGTRAVEASAPSRLDCGNTWDLPSFSLSHARHRPVTVNMALASRVSVRIEAYEAGRVKVIGLGAPVDVAAGHGSYLTVAGPVLFAVDAMGLSGVSISLRLDPRPRCGLGTSAATLVAVLGAARNLLGLPVQPQVVARDAYRVESSLTLCGFQDHLAAAFGGVNGWKWNGLTENETFERRPLLDPDGLQDLMGRAVYAVVERPNNSSVATEDWVKSFANGSGRARWLEANDACWGFADAVVRRDWNDAAKQLRREAQIRLSLCAHMLPEETLRLINLAWDHGCAARFVGAGGSVWALGKRPNVARLHEAWKAAGPDGTGANVMKVQVSADGLRTWRS